MSVVGLVVEVQEGMEQTVESALTKMPSVSIFGSKGRQIVTVIEGETMAAIDATVARITNLDSIIGVYPVAMNEEHA